MLKILFNLQVSIQSATNQPLPSFLCRANEFSAQRRRRSRGQVEPIVRCLFIFSYMD
jgi:hypothetical protein